LVGRYLWHGRIRRVSLILPFLGKQPRLPVSWVIIPTTMKYYLYISDTKVDMLLPQIPHETKKKIATSFGFDLKIIKAGRKSEEETEENRITRLEAVVAFIREYGNLGTVDEPEEYVEGNLPMRWGNLAGMESSVVYFGGVTEKTVIGLGGSMKHMIGSSNSGAVYPHSDSLTPFLMEYLLKELNLPTPHPQPIENLDLYRREQVDLTVIDAVALASQFMRGPMQNVEFVAKRLVYGRARDTQMDFGKHVLLATPLYIAMVD
jgi:hypothetical protein